MDETIRWYAGIGSRATPNHVLELMYALAKRLADRGWALRSGHAQGADQAFYEGHIVAINEPFPLAQIFLPWSGFNGGGNKLNFYDAQALVNYPKAQEIAQTVVPWWDELTDGPKALHTRNVYQILGPSLNDPVERVVCYGVPDPKHEVKGGTGTAVRLAKQYDIPVLNLHDPATFEKFEKWVFATPIPKPKPGLWDRTEYEHHGDNNDQHSANHTAEQ